MPEVYRQLVEAGELAERHVRDVCDIEFTVQHGRVFILGLRRGRRTPVANLRFALQFFAEGRISLEEVLRRVTPNDVALCAAPVLLNKSRLPLLGRGLPAGPGLATGKVVLSADDVPEPSAESVPTILVQQEVTPEDIHGIAHSSGVLTTRGGVSSHAALACRSIGKPCVVSYRPLHTTAGDDRPDVRALLREGSWITIDGTSGEVRKGEGTFESKHWGEHTELSALALLIRHAVAHGGIPLDAVGQVWRISDFFLHSVPLRLGSTSKRPALRASFDSFSPPSRRTIARIRQRLTPVSAREQTNYREILLSLPNLLSRLLSSAVGLGGHPEYFRPLWDPKQCVDRINESEGVQLVGFEFFEINRHVPHLLDFATITIFLEVEVGAESSEWFLDFTNPRGESLVTGSDCIRRFHLLINDAEVRPEDLPALYNSVRRREYFWKFYEQHGTSHGKIVDALEAWVAGKLPQPELLLLCFEIGLIRNRKLTIAGNSLLGRLRRSRRYEFKTPKCAA